MLSEWTYVEYVWENKKKVLIYIPSLSATYTFTVWMVTILVLMTESKWSTQREESFSWHDINTKFSENLSISPEVISTDTYAHGH